MAKDFFRDKGIKFEEINLDNNDKAIEELVERTGRYGVPVIEIGKELIIGFNKTKIEALLK
jgi:glutaredoxin